MTPETEYNFSLTENEANIILAGVSKLPYEVSAALIDKMKLQYAEQRVEIPAEE